METKYIVLGNLMTTAVLTGLIWFVQVVHYPSFAKVAPENFSAFHQFHVPATGAVVMFPMLTELALAFALLFFCNEIVLWQRLALSGSVFAIWALTFFVFVPLHGQLSAGYNSEVINKLVRWNWWRTVLWTGRLLGLSWLMLKWI